MDQADKKRDQNHVKKIRVLLMRGACVHTYIHRYNIILYYICCRRCPKEAGSWYLATLTIHWARHRVQARESHILDFGKAGRIGPCQSDVSHGPQLYWCSLDAGEVSVRFEPSQDAVQASAGTWDCLGRREEKEGREEKAEGERGEIWRAARG
jgi:hypothetical protein